MNKKYLLIGSIVGLLTLAAGIWVFSMNGEKTSVKMQEFIQNSCKKGLFTIQKCGNYYSIASLMNTMQDVGPTMYNNKVEIVGVCNGMDQNPSKYCKASCEEKNLCEGIEIDCSHLVTNERLQGANNVCYAENAVRMKNLTYCNGAEEGTGRDGCYYYYATRLRDINACDLVKIPTKKESCLQYLEQFGIKK